MTNWAVAILNDPVTYPMFSTTTQNVWSARRARPRRVASPGFSEQRNPPRRDALRARLTQFPAPAKPRLLVVDDDGASRRLVAAIFGAEGFDVLMAAEGRDGRSERIDDADLRACSGDLNMPEMDGLAVLEAMTARAPHVPVVMLTASHENSIRRSRDATRCVRLFDEAKADRSGQGSHAWRGVRSRYARASQRSRRAEAISSPTRRIARGSNGTERKPVCNQIVEQVPMVAASRFTVLVLGETGTGEELIAQAIHDKSERRDGPFVALDCGAIPEQLLESELFGHERGAFTGADRKKQGRFRLAEGGTLFLDEIGNLYRRRFKRSFFACSSRSRSCPSARIARRRSTCGSCLRPTTIFKRAWPAACFAPIFIFVSRSTRSRFHRFASAPRTSHTSRGASRKTRASSCVRPVRGIRSTTRSSFLEKQAWPGNVRELRNVVRQAVLTTKDVVIRKEVFHGRLLGRASRALCRRRSRAMSVEKIRAARSRTSRRVPRAMQSAPRFAKPFAPRTATRAKPRAC